MFCQRLLDKLLFFVLILATSVCLEGGQNSALGLDPYAGPRNPTVIADTGCYRIEMENAWRACYGGGARVCLKVILSNNGYCTDNKSVSVCYDDGSPAGGKATFDRSSNEACICVNNQKAVRDCTGR